MRPMVQAYTNNIEKSLTNILHSLNILFETISKKPVQSTIAIMQYTQIPSSNHEPLKKSRVEKR